MEKVIVEIYVAGHNYCAHAPMLHGCISTASTLEDMKKNFKEAIEFHVETSIRENDPIPDVFKREYELEFIVFNDSLKNVYL